MSKDLLALYQQIRDTPALTVDLPEESVGYAKPSQFSADFRKQFGILPGECRL